MIAFCPKDGNIGLCFRLGLWKSQNLPTSFRSLGNEPSKISSNDSIALIETCDDHRWKARFTAFLKTPVRSLEKSSLQNPPCRRVCVHSLVGVYCTLEIGSGSLTKRNQNNLTLRRRGLGNSLYLRSGHIPCVALDEPLQLENAIADFVLWKPLLEDNNSG